MIMKPIFSSPSWNDEVDQCFLDGVRYSESKDAIRDELDLKLGAATTEAFWEIFDRPGSQAESRCVLEEDAFAHVEDVCVLQKNAVYLRAVADEFESLAKLWSDCIVRSPTRREELDWLNSYAAFESSRREAFDLDKDEWATSQRSLIAALAEVSEKSLRLCDEFEVLLRKKIEISFAEVSRQSLSIAESSSLACVGSGDTFWRYQSTAVSSTLDMWSRKSTRKTEAPLGLAEYSNKELRFALDALVSRASFCSRRVLDSVGDDGERASQPTSLESKYLSHLDSLRAWHATD